MEAVELKFASLAVNGTKLMNCKGRANKGNGSMSRENRGKLVRQQKLAAGALQSVMVGSCGYRLMDTNPLTVSRTGRLAPFRY